MATVRQLGQKRRETDDAEKVLPQRMQGICPSFWSLGLAKGDCLRCVRVDVIDPMSGILCARCVKTFHGRPWDSADPLIYGFMSLFEPIRGSLVNMVASLYVL